MKLVLVQPPVEDFYDTEVRLQPLGLCLLKAAVKKHLPCVEVKVMDFHHGFGKRTIPLPYELSYLKEYYPHPDASPFCTFHNYYRFGADPSNLAREIVMEAPDLVGISSLFSPYFREVLACARAIKAVIEVPIVAGGGHASSCPQSLLTDPSVDYVIRGEGERPLIELIRALEGGQKMESVPGLGFKKNGRIHLNPMGEPYPMEEIPWADFSDLPAENYLYESSPMCMIMTSRGCPHQCSFCSVHAVFGSSFRVRTVEDVFSEMISRFEKGYRVFDFEDDNLAYSRKRFLRLMELIEKGFPRGRIRLFAMNGVSYESLDREILEAMRRAGFRSLNISLVSGNSRILSMLRRPHSAGRFKDVVDEAFKLGYRMVAYQIIGLPNEEVDSMKNTMAFLAGMPVLIGPSIFYLAPGSKLALETGDIGTEELVKARATAMAVEREDCKRDDLYSLFVTARIINFLKATPGLNSERSLSFKDALKALADKGGRGATGAEILARLMEEKILYAATRKGLRPLVRFNYGHFFDVMKRSGGICGTDGGMVRLKGDFE